VPLPPKLQIEEDEQSMQATQEASADEHRTLKKNLQTAFGDWVHSLIELERNEVKHRNLLVQEQDILKTKTKTKTAARTDAEYPHVRRQIKSTRDDCIKLHAETNIHMRHFETKIRKCKNLNIVSETLDLVRLINKGGNLEALTDVVARVQRILLFSMIKKVATVIGLDHAFADASLKMLDGMHQTSITSISSETKTHAVVALKDEYSKYAHKLAELERENKQVRSLKAKKKAKTASRANLDSLKRLQTEVTNLYDDIKVSRYLVREAETECEKVGVSRKTIYEVLAIPYEDETEAEAKAEAERPTNKRQRSDSEPEAACNACLLGAHTKHTCPAKANTEPIGLHGFWNIPTSCKGRCANPFSQRRCTCGNYLYELDLVRRAELQENHIAIF
jgi:hypothetical protein